MPTVVTFTRRALALAALALLVFALAPAHAPAAPPKNPGHALTAGTAGN
jgi:hypothetical protein